MILAGGQAVRMGQPKQLLLLGGKPAIWHVAAAACQAGLPEVLVVTGANATEVAAGVADLPVVIVHNPSWQQGQASSVTKGLAAVGPGAKGVLFLLADQPLIEAELLKEMVRLYQQQGAPLVLPRCKERLGNPVLLDLGYWRPKLQYLTGDEGPRRLVRQHLSQAAFVEVAEETVFLDMDTPAEYEQLSALWRKVRYQG